MFQDKRGRMWFSTNMGITRFDGRHFVTYNTVNGLPENCILNFFVESPDKVWMYAESHALFFFNPLTENVRFIKHPVSDTLLSVMQSTSIARAYIRHVYFLEDHSYILTFLTSPGFIHIDQAGGVRAVNTGDHTRFVEGDYMMYVEFESFGAHKIPATRFDKPDVPKNGQKDLIVRSPYGKELALSTALYNFNFQFGIADHFFEGDTCFLALGKYLFKMTPHEISYRELPAECLKLQGRKNDLLAGTFKGCFAVDRNLETCHTLLKDYTVDNICIDHEGGLWLSTLQQGVFYYPAQEIRQVELPDSQSISVRRVERYQNKLIVLNIERTANIFAADFSGAVITMPDISYCGYYQTKQAGCESYFGKLAGSNEYRNTYWYLNEKNTKRIIGWSGNSVYVNGKNGLVSHLLEIPRINDVAEINDSVSLAATVSGIYEIRHSADTILESQFINGRGRNFNALAYQNGVLLIGSDDKGVYIFKDDRLVSFGTERGLLSDYILEIEPAADSTFWVASSEGINQVVFGKNGRYRVDMVTISHGLTSNEITMLSLYNDTLWVAGKKGVCFFNQNNISGKDKMNSGYFYVDSLSVNNTPRSFAENLPVQLDYFDNLDLYVTQVAFANSKNISYRYRISEEDDWQVCEDNHVSVNGITQGEHRLEIQAMAGPGNYTALCIPLVVGKPFWLRLEFYLLLLLILLALGWVVYRVVLKRVQKKKDAEYERVKLEMSSLVSQMNPHFTFNTINSIQSYIINHGTRDAVIYLSDFAMLIRKTLDYSRAEYIALDEELRFINLYVALENKRFRHTFEFKENLNLVCAAAEIKWPPLLLQPLVENSIVHALSKVDSGKIELQLTEYKTHYAVVVKDNGKQDKPAASKKIKSSVGLEILRDRIRLHNGASYAESDLEYGFYESDDTSGWITQIKLYKKA